jgi:hypothetical protein
MREFPGITRYSVVPGPDESNKSPVRLQNACGTIFLENGSPTHRAWKCSPSIFGMVRKAYTAAGNFVLQGKRVSFKGAQNIEALNSIMHQLVCGWFRVRLQLVVLSVGVGRCIDVTPHSALECELSSIPWIRVMWRCEEICNVCVFNVMNWRQMESALQMQPWDFVPKSTTVSVTRRGTMTVRLTWQGADWVDNTAYEDVTRALAKFVKLLI